MGHHLQDLPHFFLSALWTEGYLCPEFLALCKWCSTFQPHKWDEWPGANPVWESVPAHLDQALCHSAPHLPGSGPTCPEQAPCCYVLPHLHILNQAPSCPRPICLDGPHAAPALHTLIGPHAKAWHLLVLQPFLIWFPPCFSEKQACGTVLPAMLPSVSGDTLQGKARKGCSMSWLFCLL